ncbi:MAG: 50S ribosomal protein L15 [Leptolyngbyaceae cyanobacterium]
MRLTDAQPKAGSKRRRRRVGRGISAGQGASCGFGMRGQKSRSGRGTRPGFEGGQLPLYRRIPKLKHFPIVNQKEFTIINVSKLSSLPSKTEVTLDSLLEAGLLTTNDGPLKVLGDGEIAVALTVNAAAFTRAAREKIEAAGGTCTVVA